MAEQAIYDMFQSQMRSRSPCYIAESLEVRTLSTVSISDEKPVPVLHAHAYPARAIATVSISDEKPVPVLLRNYSKWWRRNETFQSQMRSRSPCYALIASSIFSPSQVSISDEKPVPVLLPLAGCNVLFFTG